MILPSIPAIQIGELNIQSQYARPTTAIVEVAPEQPVNPFFSSEELDKIIKPAEPIKAPTAKKIAKLKPKPIPKPKVAQRASIAGNVYDAGNCTWYAKSKRPDLPNNLGNAKEWYYNAQSQGIPTGKTPRIGAIGVSFEGYYGHVVYITGFNGSTVTLSEMNYRGLGVISTRTAPIGEFSYIY